MYNIVSEKSIIQKSRIDWLDFAKGIGILCVVFGHTQIPYISEYLIRPFHVPLFFFLSGFCFAVKKYNFKEFLSKKIKSLLMPYIFFSLIWIVYETINETIVSISGAHDEYKCGITVKHVGSFIRGEAVAERIEPVVDMAVDDLKRKLRKLKTFFVDKKRKGGIDEIAGAFESFDDDVAMDDFDQVYYDSVDIARAKHITPNIMTDDEAIVQMEMLGHSFFVYLGIDGETKIVYKRKNGYGLLVCE